MFDRFYKLIPIFWIMMSLSSQASAGLFGPSDYDECILDSLKGVTSDTAARAIETSCRAKFPFKKVEKEVGSFQGGWTLNSDGTGSCGLAWDGAKFYNWLPKESNWLLKQENIRLITTTYDNGTEIDFFVPAAIWEWPDDTAGWSSAQERKFEALKQGNSGAYFGLNALCSYSLPI